MTDYSWLRGPKANRGKMDTERRQGVKAHVERRPEIRAIPTDCEECGQDCYRFMVCKVKACPYKGYGR